MMLQLFKSKLDRHRYRVGQTLSTISFSFVITLMVNVRKGVTMSLSFPDRLENVFPDYDSNYSMIERFQLKWLIND